MATETTKRLFDKIHFDAQQIVDWGTKNRAEFARPKNVEYDELNQIATDLCTQVNTLEVEVNNLTEALYTAETERDEYRSKVGDVPKGFFGKLKYAFTN